jgi:hypothetical protein
VQRRRMAEMFTVKVEEATPAAGGRPSAGPVYRSIYARDGLMELPQDIQSPWDFFRFGSWHWHPLFFAMCFPFPAFTRSLLVFCVEAPNF